MCKPHHDAKTRRGRKAREDPSAMTEQHRGQRSLRPLPLLTLPLKQHDDAQDADDELGGSEAHRADEDDDVDPPGIAEPAVEPDDGSDEVQTPMFNEVRMIVPTNQNIRWAPALTRAPTFTNPNS